MGNLDLYSIGDFEDFDGFWLGLEQEVIFDVLDHLNLRLSALMLNFTFEAWSYIFKESLTYFGDLEVVDSSWLEICTMGSSLTT